MENKLKISKRLVILLIISLIIPVTILADTVAFKTVVSKNDMTVGGDFWLDVQMQINAGTSPRTLNSLTADVYFGNEISYASADNWAYGSALGYSRSATDLTDYIRVGTTGTSVGTEGSGDPAGWSVTTSWQTVVTLKFTIATATSVNISINDATNDAAYFNNIANNPTGAGVTDWTVSNEDGGDIPLPVIISSFTASYSKNSAVLNWITQSETDNLGWNLYRGFFENGYQSEDYIQINSELIPGAGNSTIPTYYSFVDEYPVVEGSTYWYWLECVSTTNQLAFFGPVPLEIPIVGEIPVVMLETFMNPNYPNPFNPSTLINFNIEEGEKGTLTIFNIKGQVVLQEKFEAGFYNFEWNAKGISSGIYFYRLLTPTKNITKKMMLMK